MLYISSGLFLVSFFWIMSYQKKYFNEKVEQIIPIMEKNNYPFKKNNIHWQVDDDCNYISAEFLKGTIEKLDHQDDRKSGSKSYGSRQKEIELT